MCSRVSMYNRDSKTKVKKDREVFTQLIYVKQFEQSCEILHFGQNKMN